LRRWSSGGSEEEDGKVVGDGMVSRESLKGGEGELRKRRETRGMIAKQIQSGFLQSGTKRKKE